MSLNLKDVLETCFTSRVVAQVMHQALLYPFRVVEENSNYVHDFLERIARVLEVVQRKKILET